MEGLAGRISEGFPKRVLHVHVVRQCLRPQRSACGGPRRWGRKGRVAAVEMQGQRATWVGKVLPNLPFPPKGKV